MEEIETNVAKCREAGSRVDQAQAQFEYYNSWGVRGDNTPECAKYLGYVSFEELYPGFKGRSLTDYLKEMVEGKAAKPYSQ